MKRSHNEFSVRYIRAEKTVAKRMPRDHPLFRDEVLKVLEADARKRRVNYNDNRQRIALP